MKRIFLLIAGALVSQATAIAQWVVYDPTVHSQQIVDQAQNIAKYVEMINNQIEQINTLTSQLQELQNYNKAFGDPAKLLDISGVKGLVRELRKGELGQSIGHVQQMARGFDAMTHNANGLYHSIGTSFRTPSGETIAREEKIYRDNAAIHRSTQNYTNVFNDVRERRRALKDEIASTTEKLQSAATASEVEKLTGVLVGLNAALAATDKEIDQALSLAIVQEAENRNNVEKQAKARGEEQKAEFTESLKNYHQTFRAVSQPAFFPEEKR
jgi:uncharacterized phage infection (PIP) family protein YhgE